jgi:hypothetical protein
MEKRSKSLFGRLNNEVRRNSTDKATVFHRSSLREKALPQNACRPKNSVNLCESVSNFSLCLRVFVAETQLAAAKPLAKTGQSKQVNYAKQTQFPKFPNGYKLSKYKEL